MNISYSIVIRKNYIRKTDGKCALYLRIIDNRTVTYKHSGIWVRPSQWDGMKVNRRNENHEKINEALGKLLIEAKNIETCEAMAGLTKEKASSKKYDLKKNGHDFFKFFTEYVNQHEYRLSTGTLRNYYSEISKLKKFRNELNFIDINKQLIYDYEEYMINVLHNRPNTISKTYRKIKVIVGEACRQEKIKSNPFSGYKMPKEPTHREYLSWDELRRMESLLKTPAKENMRIAVEVFLFGCYTGLRYKDLSMLESKHIRDGMIVMRMLKTGEFVSIPLSKRAKALIKPREGKLFRVFNNQKMNEYLKLATLQARIQKKVTFHVSRHTFATLSLNLGIPLEVVSKLLGHNDLKTTQIYAKLMDKTKREMMMKWDECI